MTTKELLNNIATTAFGKAYQEEICNMYKRSVAAGHYVEEEKEYAEAISFLQSALSKEEAALFTEYEDTCTKIREFSATYGFQAGLLCGFKQFFTDDSDEDGGFTKYVSNQIAMMPNMRTYPESFNNIERRNLLYSAIIDKAPEDVHTHMVSVDCTWSQRAHSASINGFYCGYRGAMAIIDEVMPLPYSSAMNTGKTITMEYRLGFIQSFSEQEMKLV